MFAAGLGGAPPVTFGAKIRWDESHELAPPVYKLIGAGSKPAESPDSQVARNLAPFQDVKRDARDG